MNQNKYSDIPHMNFEIHQINLTEKIRDSPTSSILKTPTAIFVTTRNSSAKTKRLKFANGPVDLSTLKNGTHESNISFDSGVDSIDEKKLNNNGEISFEDNTVEVAISPVKTMQVSPESWKAFLEYKKYNDYANETEKTDYTYSRLSKFRHKEIIPGFLIRPNLSRSSISSRRSSYSLPSSQSSINESYYSGSYEFRVHNQSNPEITHFVKTSSQPNKFVRSKYYLRSSSLDWKSSGEIDSSAQNYLEKDYYVHSPSENITKTYSYSTTELPEPTSTPYYAKVRSMDFDDADIDEVDVNLVHSEKHYYTSPKVDSFGVRSIQSQPVSNYFTNFFTTVFFYFTSVGTLTKDLFSKHILRRQDNWNRSPSALYNWGNDSLNKPSTAGKSWIPWRDKTIYSTRNYYSGGCYGQPKYWYQKIYYYFCDKVSQMSNLIWGNTIGYNSQRYERSRRRFWWFLIPLILLTGSFLGYIDFFSNPKAILNTMYNWALFVPSFLNYTVMVFIPWLIFEAIPYLILKAIPNFVTVTLPHFILNSVPYYFWVVVHFFASMSFSTVWNVLVGAFNFALTFLMTTGESLYNVAINLISSGYLLSSKFLMLFYSNFCMQFFHLLTVFFQYADYFFDFIHHGFTFIINLFK